MNIFDALNSLIKAKTIVPDPTQAIAQQVTDAAQKGNWNLGQFGANAAGGVGKLAGAVVGLPGAAFKAVTQPDTVPETVTNAIKQTGMDINNAFGQPVNPQSGHLQMPNAGEAAQNFYNDPVNAALNYSIVGGAAKNLVKHFATSAAEDAALTGAEGVKGATAAEGAAKTAVPLPGGSVADIPQAATESFRTRYTVPTKRAGKNDLNTVGTSQEILAHVKSGGDLRLGNVSDAPGFVTGENGIISKMTRQAVGGVNTEIPLASAGKAAEDYLNTKKVLVPADKAEQIVADISKATPNGENIAKMNAQDAMDYARQLEEKAAEFRRGSTYLTPRPEMEAMGKAYSQAADTIMEQIDKNSRGVNIEAVKTPENMAELQKFSPRLAAQVQNAQDVSQLRSTAAPFVRLSKMQELHEAAQGSTMNKAVNKVSQFVKPATVAGTTAGATFGPMGALAGAAGGALVDEAMGPIYNAGISKIREPLQNAATNAMLNNKGGLSLPFAGAVNAAALPAAALVVNGKSAEQNNSNNNPSNHTMGGSISQFDPNVNTIDKIPQNPGDLHQNPDGTYSIANIYSMKDTNGNQLFMSPQDIKNQQLQIDAAKNTPAYRYDPGEQMRVGKMEAQLNTIKGFSSTIGPEYQKALTKNNAYSRAIVDLNQAGKSILNVNGKFDDFVKQISEKNADLATQLKVIEAAGGINPNVEIKGSTLLGALQTAQQGGLFGFYNTLSSTVGYTGSGTQPPAAVQQAVAPQIGQDNNAGGGLMAPGQGGLMGPSFAGGTPAIAQ